MFLRCHDVRKMNVSSYQEKQPTNQSDRKTNKQTTTATKKKKTKNKKNKKKKKHKNKKTPKTKTKTNNKQTNQPIKQTSSSNNDQDATDSLYIC